VRDPELLRTLHVLWRGECVLETISDCYRQRYSLHHIHRHPRDDVRGNLVMLCGDGVQGHHGQITAESSTAKAALGQYILAHRLDTLRYLADKLGDEQARAWLRARLYAPV
jgi:hypothetical protein